MNGLYFESHMHIMRNLPAFVVSGAPIDKHILSSFLVNREGGYNKGEFDDSLTQC